MVRHLHVMGDRAATSALALSPVSPFPIPRDYPMKTPVLLRICFACCATAGSALASTEIVAIASKTAKDYVRKKLPDGTFQPESYTFGKGDNLGGARVDPTIDHMDFMDIARTIAVPLAAKKYFPTQDPKTTNELIMVYWGTTLAPEFATESNTHMELQQANQYKEVADQLKMQASAAANSPNARSAKMIAESYAASVDGQLLAATIGVQAENQEREDRDLKTATLLGYDSWWVKVNASMDGGPMGRSKADMRSELEEDRYFVILSAFDYQTLVRQKKQKFLWEVRYSIREHGNDFEKRLPSITAVASDYFGRDSQGLHHVEVPDGKVLIGPVESLGTVAGK
jgi:hypothetical protein